MAKITKEPQPLHPVVADALQVAVDLLAPEDEDRARLLREMIPGFACKPSKGNHWRLVVRKFHVGLVTRCLSGVVDAALSNVRQDLIQELGDRHDGRFFGVHRENGKSPRRNGEFHFEFDLRVDNYQSEALHDMFVEWGPQKSISYVNQRVRDRIHEKISETFDFQIKMHSRHESQPSQPYATKYMLNSTWRLVVPVPLMMEHLGFGNESE